MTRNRMESAPKLDAKSSFHFCQERDTGKNRMEFICVTDGEMTRC
jgi:hypothetical protein